MTRRGGPWLRRTEGLGAGGRRGGPAGARAVCTWAAGCSCRLVLPPVIAKIVCHLRAGLDVGGPLRKSRPWRGLALSQPGVGLQHAEPLLGQRRLRPAALASELPRRLPGSRAQLVAVSTLVLLGRLGMETRTKSSRKHKVRKSHKQANKKDYYLFK